MHETRIRLFMPMELVAYRDECKWLLRCHRCIVKNCPEEYCPTIPLPIPDDYVRNLIERWEMAKKGSCHRLL